MLLFLDLKKHPFFSDIDWFNIHEMTPRFVPSPEDDTDTSYFDG